MSQAIQNNMQFIDQNNPLLAGGPAKLDGGTIESPATGKMGVLTMRTSSGTLTAMMDADSLRNWAKFIDSLADEVEGKKHLQPATMQDVAVLDGSMPFRKC